jgi:hypothetical protein
MQVPGRLQSGAMLGELAGLLRRPSTTLAGIDTRRGLGQGMLALGLSATLPAVVSEIAALGPFRPPANLGSLPSLTAQGADIYARWVYQQRFVLPIYGVLISVGLWVAAAGLIHLIARALRGRGSFSGFLTLAGYIALVGLIALPLAILDTLLKIQGNARVELAVGQLLGIAGLAVFVWQNALLVIAARGHYEISTERALAAVIGPIGAVTVLIVIFVLLAVILAVIAQSGPAS